MDPDAKPGEEPASIVVDAEVVAAPSSADLAEEQRKWHEDRIRRRLNREYERAGKALSEVVSWALRSSSISRLRETAFSLRLHAAADLGYVLMVPHTTSSWLSASPGRRQPRCAAKPEQRPHRRCDWDKDWIPPTCRLPISLWRIRHTLFIGDPNDEHPPARPADDTGAHRQARAIRHLWPRGSWSATFYRHLQHRGGCRSHHQGPGKEQVLCQDGYRRRRRRGQRGKPGQSMRLRKLRLLRAYNKKRYNAASHSFLLRFCALLFHTSSDCHSQDTQRPRRGRNVRGQRFFRYSYEVVIQRTSRRSRAKSMTITRDAHVCLHRWVPHPTQQVRLSAPITASPDTLLSLTGFAIERDLSAYASCRERLRGAKLGLRVRASVKCWSAFSQVAMKADRRHCSSDSLSLRRARVRVRWHHAQSLRRRNECIHVVSPRERARQVAPVVRIAQP